MWVWFENVLSLMRIHIHVDGGSCEIHKRRNGPQFKQLFEQELYFVQCYDVLSDKELPLDSIDMNIWFLSLH